MKILIQALNSCPQRKPDVARYRRALEEAGHELVSRPEESDVILVWTCSFRQDHHDNSLKVLQEYQGLGKKVVACGCLPSIDPAGLGAVFSGEVVEWKDERSALQKLFGIDVEDAPRAVAEAALAEPYREYQARHPTLKVTYGDQFHKLFVGEGCNLKCSYCAELKAFPPFRSFPLDTLVDKTRKMVARSGERRVVLHGDLVGGYGEEIGSSLEELLTALFRDVAGILIGLENLHPLHWLRHRGALDKHIGRGGIFLISSPIQSACDRILRLMNRPYGRADLEGLFRSVQGVAGLETQTHVIAGFPTESEAEFEETLDFLLRYPMKWVLTSAFMAAPGTLAAQLPGQVPYEEKRRRLQRANERLTAAGIHCNFDMGQGARERFARPMIDQLVD